VTHEDDQKVTDKLKGAKGTVGKDVRQMGPLENQPAHTSFQVPIINGYVGSGKLVLLKYQERRHNKAIEKVRSKRFMNY